MVTLKTCADCLKECRQKSHFTEQRLDVQNSEASDVLRHWQQVGHWILPAGAEINHFAPGA